MIDLYEYFTSHEYLPKRLHEALQNFSNEYEYLVLEDEEVLCDKQEDIRCLNDLLPQNTLFYKYFLYALLDENHLKRKPKSIGWEEKLYIKSFIKKVGQFTNTIHELENAVLSYKSKLKVKPEIRYITEKDTILREEIKTLKDDNRKMADFILSNFTPEQIKELNDKNRRLKINEKIHKGMDVK